MLRRGMMSGGGGGGGAFADYAAYAAYVNGLTVDKAVSDSFVSQFGSYGSPIGLCRWNSSDNTTTSGDMFGSPWAANRALRQNNSHVSRVMLHSIENTGSLRSGANVVLINSSSFTGTYDATSRHGYTSLSSGSTSGLVVNWVVYWDTLLGKARKFDAVAQTWEDWAG
jgi:hypothetical protein